jgi:hypothetical protein
VPVVTFIWKTVVKIWDEIVHYTKTALKWIPDPIKQAVRKAIQRLGDANEHSRIAAARLKQGLAKAAWRMGDAADDARTDLKWLSVIPGLNLIPAAYSAAAYAGHGWSLVFGGEAPTQKQWATLGNDLLGMLPFVSESKMVPDGSKAQTGARGAGGLSTLGRSASGSWTDRWLPHTLPAYMLAGVSLVCFACYTVMPFANAAGDPDGT